MKTGFFLSTLWVVALYKLWLIGIGRPEALLTGYAVEALVWGALWLPSVWLERSRRLTARIAGNALFYPLWAISLVSSFVHTYFFDSAAERRFSLLDVNLDQLGFFFQDVLPLAGLLTLLALLGVLTVSSVLLARTFKTFSLRWPAYLLAVHAGLVGVIAYNVPHIPSPMVDIVADVHELLVHPEIEVDGKVKAAGPMSALDKSRSFPASLATPFKKIVIIVMETMNDETLREQTETLKDSTFLRQAVSHAHTYARYYTSNQDSRTGMLGMLSSRFIPYEAYTEAGRDHYMHLSRKSSLPDVFHRLGYETAFAVSQTDLELVVADLAWQQKLTLSPADVDQAQPRFLCFNPYEFEHSCEDKVLLPRVVKFLVDHERALVYQEMIWGHASEYNEASGKTNAAYYSEYLDGLIAALNAHGVLDDTLIVLTADHGFRDKAMQLEPEIYQIPLLFFATRFEPQRHLGLYSHLDFKDLLLNELAPGSTQVADNPFVFVIGPTGTSIRAVVTREGGFLAFKERESARYLLRQYDPPAVGGTLPSALRPEAYLKLFDAYRVAFDSASVTH